MAFIRPMIPFDLVVIGGTGDLALRKMLPALYYLAHDDRIPETSQIICSSRKAMSTEDYHGLVKSACEEQVAKGHFKQDSWSAFARSLTYLAFNATDPDDYNELKGCLKDTTDRARVFYLATSSDLYGPICESLKQNGLITSETRIVLEKPIGHDLPSAQAINETISQCFSEDQIYRIDHYLGKETVQNLKVLRFGNALFEPLWNSTMIEHVQITVAEDIGIGDRGAYYDASGALRDMVQNHLLQLLCLIAMEPPLTDDANAIRDEKIKVLKALKPFQGTSLQEDVVIGQYQGSRGIKSYTEEPDIPKDSATETFAAMKVQINNWRWAGVPFYIRTGKRMRRKISEIVLQFKKVGHSIFDPSAGKLHNNQLVIRLQPDEGIKLKLMTKTPGTGIDLQPAYLNLNFAETFKHRHPDAYERLIMDVIRGIPTLFMRRDEVETAWEWIGPLIEGLRENCGTPHLYPAGSWGPKAAQDLIQLDGYTWHCEDPDDTCDDL